MINLLDPIMGPLLNLDPIIAIAIVSCVLSILSALITKYTTNQKKIKQHREELKALQVKAKAVRDDPKKAMSYHTEMMEKNMVVMKESFKPMIITMIPFLLVFAWLNANLAYIPIEAGAEFDVTAELRSDMIGTATLEVLPADMIEFVSDKTAEIADKSVVWKLRGDTGLYTLKYNFSGEVVEQDLEIGSGYVNPVIKHSGTIKKTTIGNVPRKINIFGINLGWFLVYFIFSMIFGISIRKMLKVS